MIRRMETLVMALRQLYGVRFEQPNHKGKCLDYVISWDFIMYRMRRTPDCCLVKEHFLYNCFIRIYQDRNPNCFSVYEQKLFYLYLLIKHQFRSELIQVNRGVGFHNFLKYQDRKNLLFEKYNEYNVEAQRLAVVAARKENYIQSFETRIMVLPSRKK